jgi:A/G-specific adenine glycosylase
VADADPIPPALRDAVLAWYAATGRPLAFRATRDPWAILVSEAMAQQTQAARAADAWQAWMVRYPTVEAVATAPLADLLRSWAGLGYNRRAVHLHRAARAIVEEHGGRVPTSVAGLRTLPGVGPYTARAVAALAFGHAVGAVDTNVRRVLGRVVAGDPAVMTPVAMQELADAAVPPGRAGEWTHAVMDLGARVCRPRRPDCEACPARRWCTYAARTSTSQGGAESPSRGLRTAARPEPRFETTSRWLRGRILARLRDATDDAWVRLDGPIGEHPPDAVRRALAAMAADGLVELGRDGHPEARLPTG